MPIRSSVTGSAAAATASYPKLMQAKVTGNVWLVTGPKTGVVIHKGASAKDAFIGYTSTKLSEKKLVPFTGELKIAA